MAMGIHAVLSDSAAAPCLCFALLQGSGASMNPYCLLLILRGEPEKLKHKILALLQQSPLLAQPSQFFHLGATELSPPS